jgi:hypothetical protein
VGNPSPIATSSNGTDFDVDEAEVGVEEPMPTQTEKRRGMEVRREKDGESQEEEKGEMVNGHAEKRDNVGGGLRPENAEEDYPNSTIHAPESFGAFVSSSGTHAE